MKAAWRFLWAAAAWFCWWRSDRAIAAADTWRQRGDRFDRRAS